MLIPILVPIILPVAIPVLNPIDYVITQTDIDLCEVLNKQTNTMILSYNVTDETGLPVTSVTALNGVSTNAGGRSLASSLPHASNATIKVTAIPAFGPTGYLKYTQSVIDNTATTTTTTTVTTFSSSNSTSSSTVATPFNFLFAVISLGFTVIAVYILLKRK